MTEALFVPKQFNTYADTFVLLGLAQLVEDALRRTQHREEMQLIDEGTYYQIQLTRPLNLEAIAQLDYTNPFLPVKGQKTDSSQIPAETDIFDVVKEVEKRKLYQQYRYQTGGKTQWTKEAPKPPDPRTQNGAILVSMRHDRNHNSLWQESWKLKDYYGSLMASLCQVLSQNHLSSQSSWSEQVAKIFQSKTGVSLPENASAVKIYFPTSVQGVNRTKADSNKVDSQKIDWLTLWLIANGLFQFAISERIKIAESAYDWRVVVLEPKDISLQKYREVLNRLRLFNPPGGGHGIARFDAELVLKLCQQLLENHAAQAQGKPENPFDFLGKPVNDFVGEFRGTHFGSKGQVYGVKELFTLGLPGWIIPDNYQDLLDYLDVIKEHLSVIVTLSAEEGHSELLAAYRDFITGTSFRQFFRFQVSYADYVVKQLANPHTKSPRLFSVNGLNIMTQKDVIFAKITKDPSFLRIAKAINQSTVYAGEIYTKEGGKKQLDWQRQYGLAQLLSSQSGSKKDFICAIADFLGKYEHENLRLSEKYLKEGKRLMRVQPYKEDLDRLIELIDEFDTVLIANLLIAYGYAKWTKSQDSSQQVTPDSNPDFETNLETHEEE
ncbi:hypothetical protein [Planktothrix sp. FACHB-1365]|uniref:hypothetical protein n=1 Tax=Planktothrix sp. FACHB-1365 TaxID=2692855 RepID=UPI001689EC7D|nr:hypothetical protein [Planktothrix sp. FACHB-1365]MBD2483325.1 hypothetical protein [Planktothrix sp. FACHB-1365]